MSPTLKKRVLMREIIQVSPMKKKKGGPYEREAQGSESEEEVL